METMTTMEMMTKYHYAKDKMEIYELAKKIRFIYKLPIIKIVNKKKIDKMPMKDVRSYLIYSIQEAWLKDTMRVPREKNNLMLKLDILS